MTHRQGSSRRFPPKLPAASASPLTKMALSNEFQIDRKQQIRKIESRKTRSTLPSGDHFFVARILPPKMPATVPFVKTVRRFLGWTPEKFLETITKGHTKAEHASCLIDGPQSLTELFRERIVQLLQAIIVILGFVLQVLGRFQGLAVGRASRRFFLRWVHNRLRRLTSARWRTPNDREQQT
jgi:hypothetical protein